MPKQVLITKADGQEQLFDPFKLEHSLERAGASSLVRARITGRVVEGLKPGTTTAEIYRHAFELLRHEGVHPLAARYSIKRAVFDLGPSGFPFEQFISEVLRGHGWSTRTDQMVTGRCAEHEVDVVAEKDGRRIGIEAKFHNEPGGKTDIKDALYVYARYEDLSRSAHSRTRIDEGWLVTNTSFTINAIHYAECANLRLLSWDYPREKNLFAMIEEANVHPLTCLTTLSESEKHRMLEQRVVLCKSILAPHTLEQYGIKPDRIPQVIEEARALCAS